MQLYFLGTGAGTPSRERNVTSIALNLYAERGSFWLFDCGEGTQHQILRSPHRLSKLEKIFITHLHGDHIYGLPGLLTSRSYQGGSSKLVLYGPEGLRCFIETVLEISKARLDYELEVVEFSEGVVFEDDQFRVEARKLDHRIDSYGFRIVESDIPGALLHEKLKEEGVAPGPIYGRIKQGEDVVLPDGRKLQASLYVAPPQPGRVVAILGDTRYCEAGVELARGADVLVHEATFDAGRADLAREYYHSTSEQAAQIARRAGARTLIMTHFSSRFAEEGVARLVEEASRLVPYVFAAYDHWSYTVSRRSGSASATQDQ